MLRNRAHEIPRGGLTVELRSRVSGYLQTIEVDGKPIKVTASGLERLELLNKESKRLSLRLQDVTLVKPGADDVSREL